MKPLPTTLLSIIYFTTLIATVALMSMLFGCATRRTDDFEPAKIIYRDTVYLQYDRCGIDTAYMKHVFGRKKFMPYVRVIVDTVCVGEPIVEHSKIQNDD